MMEQNMNGKTALVTGAEEAAGLIIDGGVSTI